MNAPAPPSGPRSLLPYAVFAALFAGTVLVAPYPGIAMWTGFCLAAYSAVANDSIQTLGTFIASNRDKPWWLCWLFASLVLAGTVLWSWHFFGGDVSHQRLADKGFAQAPTEFHFLQLWAPVFLLVLTRFRIPVSTTFLLLSCFAANADAIYKVTLKSVCGYGIAFALSIALWMVLGPLMSRKFQGKPHPWWRAFQWITTGTLWSVWLQQDASNIAVFLPRSLDPLELAAFLAVLVLGLGILFRMGGERIQRVVDEKSTVVDVRAATVIDLLYAAILFVFKLWSQLPMSTTWVFVGLLAGRELGMELSRSGEGRGLRHALRLMLKDLSAVTLAFVISLVLAVLVNADIRQELAEVLRR